MRKYSGGPNAAARLGLSIPPTDMKSSFPWLTLVLGLLLLPLTGCEAIGDIFKAGAITGIIGVVVVLILLFWLFNRFFRRG
jgi:apolipoprotein N-acyltransferase